MERFPTVGTLCLSSAGDTPRIYADTGIVCPNINARQ